MLISACVLGYTDIAKEFVKKFKATSYYKKRDSDVEGVRVHVVYLETSDLSSSGFLYRYEKNNGNYANVLNDGDQQTKKEVTLSNDRKWLLESDGHDTIIEASDNPDKYYLTLLELIKKGFTVHITSPKYKEQYIEEILLFAEQSGSTIHLHEDVKSILKTLDDEYKEKLNRQRKNLLDDSYESVQCGFETN